MRPDIDELLAAVRWTIQEALLPDVTGPYARFQALIALDLIDLIGRHWSTRVADLSADVRDYTQALEAGLRQAPGALDPGLGAAIREAIGAPLPPIPAAHEDLTRRALRLAELVDQALATLAGDDETGAHDARATLRRAVVARLGRDGERQAGLDIRR